MSEEAEEMTAAGEAWNFMQALGYQPKLEFEIKCFWKLCE
jgi:hypothetical protein